MNKIRSFTAVAALLCGLSVIAEVPKSLLPVFGTDGAEFTQKGQSDHVTKGWVPNGWNDNSDWAQVNATYSKLTDSPDKAAGAVRIKIEKIDDGQLQFTTYQGNQKYKKGTKYLVSGWVRSSSGTNVQVGVRQKTEPYEFYHEQDLNTTSEWKRFEFAFTPSMEIDTFLMFIVRDVGTVDLAGIALEEKP